MVLQTWIFLSGWRPRKKVCRTTFLPPSKSLLRIQIKRLHDLWPIPNSHQINSRNLISIDMQFDDVFSLQCSTHCSWLHCKCLKTNYGIISSRNMWYYSENCFLGGGINRDMILNETCYYLNILFVNSTIFVFKSIFTIISVAPQAVRLARPRSKLDIAKQNTAAVARMIVMMVLPK